MDDEGNILSSSLTNNEEHSDDEVSSDSGEDKSRNEEKHKGTVMMNLKPIPNHDDNKDDLEGAKLSDDGNQEEQDEGKNKYELLN